MRNGNERTQKNKKKINKQKKSRKIVMKMKKKFLSIPTIQFLNIILKKISCKKTTK